jgi:streptogrisin D
VRTRPVRSASVFGAIGLAATTLFATPAAQAAPTATPAPATQASTLAKQLGTRTAGSYLDQQTGKLVVTVTDSVAAQSVLAAGAVPKTVTRSGADLEKATATLDRSVRIPGTAWGIDPAANQVRISVDESVTGAKLAKVQSVAKSLGDAARIEHVAGTFQPLISGGQSIYHGGATCSLGFNVKRGSTFFFLTAGHCTEAGTAWYADINETTRLGVRAGTRFPGSDYGIVRYDDGITHPGNVWLYNNSSTRDMTDAADPVVGQSVTRSGATSGLHSGTVTAVHQTVNYGDGDLVLGLIMTTVCSEPGDSGGPLFAGNTALGLTSGGSGDCSEGGITFFQPVVEALNDFNVTIY